MSRTGRPPSTPETPAPQAGAPAATPAPLAEPERRWRMLRAVYPVNPGIPHYFDVPAPRAG